LVIALALLTVLGLVLSVTASLTIWAPVICAALTGGVIGAGRYAVAAERRSARTESALQEATGVEPAQAAKATAARTSQTKAAGSRAASVERSPEPAEPARTADRAASSKETAARSATKAARRPGISGRIESGRSTYHLPKPLPIAEAQPDEVLLTTSFEPEPLGGESEAKPPRRFTTARPKQVTEPEPEAEASEPERWTPHEVPAPTYTLMSGAPRWEPKPLTALDYRQAQEAAARVTEQAAQNARAEGVEPVAANRPKVPRRVIFSEGALDLDRAIASRRRAAGAN
jgi:hypothetical protein